MSTFDGTRGLRQPPLKYEAEQALLATLLANNGVFGLIAGMVTAEGFADPPHELARRLRSRAGRTATQSCEPTQGAAPQAANCEIAAIVTGSAGETNFGTIFVAPAVSRSSHSPHGWPPARRSACAARRCESAVSLNTVDGHIFGCGKLTIHLGQRHVIFQRPRLHAR
jgi:hypothetical protein